MNLFFASCPVGLEEVLLEEIKSLDIANLCIERGGVSFETDLIFAFKVILYSRIVSRVYLSINSFDIFDEKDIYKKAVLYKWFELFNIDQSFKINSIISNEIVKSLPNKFKNSIYLSQILKDAIVDAFRNKLNSRPSVDKQDADINILQRISFNKKVHGQIQTDILIDLCGEPLHQRGYRRNACTAPVKENLAAGLIKLMNWDYENEVFIDTTCGSGTFLIEAALIKGNIPPSFMKLDNLPWKFIDMNLFNKDEELKKTFKAEIQKCKEAVEKGIIKLSEKNQKIYGSDIDPDAIFKCKKNVQNAGLGSCIEVSVCEASMATPYGTKKGIVFCNPPYGERLGELKELETTYYNYGENLKKNFKGFRAFIITGNQELRKKISLRTSSRIAVYNGKIECRLLEYKLF